MMYALYFEKLPSAAFFGECASPRQAAPLSCQCAVREACILRILHEVFHLGCGERVWQAFRRGKEFDGQSG